MNKITDKDKVKILNKMVTHKANGSDVTSLATGITIWVRVIGVCFVVLTANIIQVVFSMKEDKKKKAKTPNVSIKRGKGFNLSGKVKKKGKKAKKPSSRVTRSKYGGSVKRRSSRKKHTHNAKKVNDNGKC